MKVLVRRGPTPPAALLMDLGNTRLGMATWYEGRTHPGRHFTLAELERDPAWLAQAWRDLPDPSERYVVISSVSPPGLEVLSRLVSRHCDGVEPLIVGVDLVPPIKVNVAAPEKVGTDRLCSAAAAWKQAQTACAVASFGTAITIDLISDDGVFMGGAILPGLAMSARALHEHTALLPSVEITPPTEVWGTDTAEAIRVGVFCGAAGALREITERYAEHIGKWPVLMLTGGDAAAIAQAVNFADAIVPDLCLRGIALALESALLTAP